MKKITLEDINIARFKNDKTKALNFIEQVNQYNANMHRFLENNSDEGSYRLKIARHATSDHPPYTIKFKDEPLAVLWNTTELQRLHFKNPKSNNTGLCEVELFNREAYLKRRQVQANALTHTGVDYLFLAESDLHLADAIKQSDKRWVTLNETTLNSKLGHASTHFQDDNKCRSGLFALKKGVDPNHKEQQEIARQWNEFIAHQWKDRNGNINLPKQDDLKNYQEFRMIPALIQLPNKEKCLVFVVHYKFIKPCENQIANAIHFAKKHGYRYIIAGDYNRGVGLDPETAEMRESKFASDKAHFTVLQEENLSKLVTQPENIKIKSGGGGTMASTFDKTSGVHMPRSYLSLRDYVITNINEISIEHSPDIALKPGRRFSPPYIRLCDEVKQSGDAHYQYQKPFEKVLNASQANTHFSQLKDYRSSALKQIDSLLGFIDSHSSKATANTTLSSTATHDDSTSSEEETAPVVRLI